MFLKKTYESMEDVYKINEIQNLKRLPNHPNILRLIELVYDKASGKVALVFENMESDLHTLNTDRPDNETILESTAQNYVYQLLKGIKHLHSYGMIHGNITSRNVFTSKELIKILPLQINKPEYSKITSYSAPELIISKPNYDFKIDIWAAGCIFYELLKTKPLFRETTPYEHLDQIHQILGTPKPSVLEKYANQLKTDNEFEFKRYEFKGLGTLLPNVSQEFQDMILWLLTYDPDRRPSAATALKHPFFKELHLSRIQNQDYNLRAQHISKVISGVPLLPTETEQGGIRKAMEESKEDSKGENAYSLERSKIGQK